MHLYMLQIWILAYHFLKTSSYPYSAEGIDKILRRIRTCNASIILAGLFPMEVEDGTTKSVKKKTCTGKISHSGVEEALAMIFAVLEVNDSPTYLPGVTVTMDIKNTCDSVEYAIQNALQFDAFQTKYWQLVDGHHLFPQETSEASQGPFPAAIVGVRKSSIARSIAVLTNIFSVPFISYGSTSYLFSDKSKYHSFFRTVPSDRSLIRMLISILQKLKRNYVRVFQTNTDYANAAVELFKDEVKEAMQGPGSVCIAQTTTLRASYDEELKKQLRINPEATTIIVFAHREHGTKILTSALKQGFDNLTWIFSESVVLTRELCGLFKANNQTEVLTISPLESIYGGYLNFRIAALLSKEIPKILPQVKSYFSLKNWYRHHDSPYVNNVINSVFAVAAALHSRYQCTKESCKSPKDVSRRSLRPELLKAKIKGADGKFHFDKNGDLISGYYAILRLRIILRRCRFSREGYVLRNPNGKHSVHHSYGLKVHQQFCVESCPPGWGIVVTDKAKQTCCWHCRKCVGNEFSLLNMTRCEPCHSLTLPDENHTTCTPMKKKNITYGSPIAIGMLSVTCIGEASLIIVAIVFILYRNTHLVRATSKELFLIKIAGTTLGYATPLIIINLHTTLQCSMFLYVSALSFSLTMGSLFTRNNRIYRIFHKNSMRKGSPRFLSTGWQILIVMFFVVGELAALTYVVHSTKHPVSYMEEKSTSGVELESVCRFDVQVIGLYWVSQSVIVFMCTYQAILTRNIPDDYNEARSIYISMMTITIQLIFLLPTFYYTAGTYKIFVLCFFVLLSATAVTVCIFLPKVYIILFNPKKNMIQQPFGTLGTFTTSDNGSKDVIMGGEPSWTGESAGYFSETSFSEFSKEDNSVRYLHSDHKRHVNKRPLKRKSKKIRFVDKQSLASLSSRQTEISTIT